MPDDTRKREERYLAERARKVEKVFGGFRERGVEVEIERAKCAVFGVKDARVKNADVEGAVVENADVQAVDACGREGK